MTRILSTIILRKPPIRTNDYNGFTLIELVCVIAIMSILFGVVFFSMDDITAEQRLRSDARNLIGFVKSARNLAMIERRFVYIVYDLENNICFTCDSPGETERDDIDPSRRISLHDGNVLQEIQLSGGTPANKKNIQLCVSALGDIESHTIVLKGEDGIMNIRINGVTGAVEVHRNEEK